MANILESKARLKQILYTNKDRFTKEIFDYLNSLLELEFAVTKEYISTKSRIELAQDEIYYQVALYNIYHLIDNLLTKLDTTKFVSYDALPHYDSYEMQGISKLRDEANSNLFRLIRILYNFEDWQNISIVNDLYLSSEGEVTRKKAEEFFIKRDLSQELHKELLQEFALEKIEFVTIPSKLIKEDIGWSTSVTKKEQKLVRTLPGITFTHELHQEYFTKK